MCDGLIELARLGEILDMEYQDRLNISLAEIQNIVDALKPEDFAIYGRQLCQLLIDVAHGKRTMFANEGEPNM